MPTQSRKIFIDSSVLLSFIDRSDQNHSKGIKSIESIAELKFQAYTSHQNVSEAYTTLVGEVGISVALDFLQAILQSDIEIIYPQKTDLVSAYRLLRTNRDRQIGLQEVLNASLMRKKGITQVLTFAIWHNLFGTYVSNLAGS